jgi:hypothetical protein
VMWPAHVDAAKPATGACTGLAATVQLLGPTPRRR